MGAELGELHFLLWKDLTWLHIEWQEYKELFGKSESRIALMNDTAPQFFVSLDRVLFQDIVLSLSRLSDPPGTGGQQNLTLLRLPSLIRDAALRAQCNAALDDFSLKTQFARNWRHRRFAHRELDHATDAGAHPLAHASRVDIEAALTAARTAMNLLELHFQGNSVAYEYSSGSNGGASALLWFLDAGLEADQLRRAEGRRWRPRYETPAT
jgi:hypothetical protein